MVMQVGHAAMMYMQVIFGIGRYFGAWSFYSGVRFLLRFRADISDEDYAVLSASRRLDVQVRIMSQALEDVFVTVARGGVVNVGDV